VIVTIAMVMIMFVVVSSRIRSEGDLFTP